MGKQRKQDDAPEPDAPAAGEPESVADLTFEKALKALETLVEQMEDGELSLEDAVRCYERGVALHQHCQRALDTAEQKVRILTERGDGAELAPFTQEGEDQL